ncbi:MAG: hypothetical protein AAF627_06975 [Myxococcota bacterium]
MFSRTVLPAFSAALLLFATACGESTDSGNGTSGNGSGNGAGNGSGNGTGNGTGGVDMGVVVDMGGGMMDAGGEPDAGAEPACSVNSDCSGETPFCDLVGELCAPAPRGGLIGWGDGSLESVTIESIHQGTRTENARTTDLAFNPDGDNEIWLAHRMAQDERPCDAQGARTGCFALQGSTTTIVQAGTPDQTEAWIMDFNAWHFMRRPPAIAWGENGFFATCGYARTGNFLDDTAADFIGPSLWTSDPEIYRNWDVNSQPPGWNGTHMDMLHATPWCMGIAHETGNVYWVANGQIGSLDRYDFAEDHGPGQADHSDGEIQRYAIGTLTREPWVPGHLEFHDGIVYVSDSGNGRVISFDPTDASRIGGIRPQYEPLAFDATYSGGTITEVVPPGGILETPSGLAIHDDVLYVSDNATGELHAFELDGTYLRSLDTGLEPGHVAGIEVSPDGVLYYVDMLGSELLRVLPK